MLISLRNGYMEDAGLWLSPLLLIPGAGLMIMSTSARYAQIHNEMHHLLEHQHGNDEHMHMVAKELMGRSVLFRNALVCLYASITFLAVAGLVGAMFTAFGVSSFLIVLCLTGFGIGCLVLAALILIRESIKSLSIIREHYDELCSRKPGEGKT
ncbi:MAG: DUF2721 domain-containing protein [Bacteroidota bacterium]